MNMDAFATTLLILLHGPDGHDIRVNPSAVTSMHSALPNEANKLFDNDVRCVVGLSDGKFVSVVEHCPVVQKMMEEALK